MAPDLKNKLHDVLQGMRRDHIESLAINHDGSVKAMALQEIVLTVR
jgi:hypothetical protein